MEQRLSSWLGPQREATRAGFPFRVALVFLAALIGAELATLMVLNHGTLTYTLDDAYIHLALAEHISHGHYGINATEFSAPSSSILWPFILAPAARFELGLYAPLVLNIAFAVATLYVFVRMATLAIGERFPGVIAVVSIALVLATNTVGLVFIGLEHSLQLLITALIALGLALDSSSGALPGWLPLAIVAGPLVRYESAAVSLVALTYLFCRGRYRLSIALGLIIALSLGAFSVFLVALGLGPLPTSILAKTAAVGTGGQLGGFALHLRESVTNDRGTYLMVCALFLLAYAAFGTHSRKRLLALVAPLAIALHMVVGQYGWYNRYEVYVWAFAVLLLLFLYGGSLCGLLESPNARVNAFKIAAASLFITALVCYRYVVSLASLPIASNNIYEQQCQMRRFAVDYYRAPVAVNDLGYVAWHNDHYVLDLFGLGSRRALAFRFSRPDSQWMDDLTRANGVGLVMIYDTWVNQGVPHSWIEVGELNLGRLPVTAERTVKFYVLNEPARQVALAALARFSVTLPADVEFVFTKPNQREAPPSSDRLRP
jgi:hypothetical protein